MKKAFRFLGFTAIICVLVLIASMILNVTDPKLKFNIKAFYYEPENTIDVALIGSSECYTDFCSPLAWRDYGFTSYSFAYGAATAPTYTALAKEVLTKQKPKLFVVNLDGYVYDDEYSEDPAIYHAFYDNLPNDEIKKESMKKNIPPDKMFDFIFPLYKYHVNWKTARYIWDSFKTDYYLNKYGFSYTKAYAQENRYIGDRPKEKIQNVLTDKNKAHLIELLELFKEQNIPNALFMQFPHYEIYEDTLAYDEMKNIISSYGYDCLNLRNDFEFADLKPEKDFYNLEHLNVYGLEKFTKNFGKYIVDHYNVKSDYSEETINQWNICVEKTEKLNEECKADTDKNRGNYIFGVDAYKY